MSKDSLYKEGLSEREVYPSQSIQIKSTYYDYIQGNVRLSERQRNELEKEESKNRKKIVKLLLD